MVTGRLLPTVLIAFLIPLAGAAAEENSFEEAVELNAADMLPAELMQGEYHRVDNRVRSDGYLNYYTIHSDFGEFEAASTAMLMMRVGEIDALAALDELSKTEVFAKAAMEAGVKQLRTVKEFATKPVETVKGIPKGIGRMFKRYSRRASEAVDAASEAMAGDDEDAPVEGDDESEDDTNKARELTESYVGVDKAQRAWARKLGTDPYSSNEVLQAAIKEVAWAERLGKMGMGFAGVPKIPGADIIADVNEAVWSKDPYELKDLNRARLEATGATAELIEQYLDNARLTPSQQTLLTAAIAELEGVEGRDGILNQSLALDGEVETNFFIKSLTMLAWYHRNRNPVASVETGGVIPGALLGDGAMILAFAVDHLYWTQEIAKAADRYASLASDGKEVWFLGTASERCAAELKAQGWDVYVNVADLLTEGA